MQGIGAQGAAWALRLAACRRRIDRHGIAGILILTLAITGCNTSGPTSLADARGFAIAFESIEGPPAQVVQKFERDITDEAAARQIAVVPRGGGALYRIRAYLAPNAQPQAPSIAWAWDVYDGNQRRAFRLTGTEPAGAGRRPSAEFWAAADDAVLRRIARAGMEQLVVFIASARAPSVAPEGAPVSRAALAHANPDE